MMKSLRPKPRPSSAPSKSRRPPPAGPAREENAIKQKLESIFRSDQGTVEALPTKKFRDGGCVMAGRGGSYKGTM